MLAYKHTYNKKKKGLPREWECPKTNNSILTNARTREGVGRCLGLGLVRGVRVRGQAPHQPHALRSGLMAPFKVRVTHCINLMH